MNDDIKLDATFNDRSGGGGGGCGGGGTRLWSVCVGGSSGIRGARDWSSGGCRPSWWACCRSRLTDTDAYVPEGKSIQNKVMESQFRTKLL